MDESQFDRWTRELGRGTSRRTMIKSMVGVAGAFVAGSRLGLERTEAARRGYSGPSLPVELPVPPICPDDRSWNGATCVCASGVTCGSVCCNEGTICTDAGCAVPPPVCPEGQEWDGSACVCTAGATCGAACCADGTLCSSGTCVPNPGCFSLGESCTQNSDCCSSLCTESVCRQRTGGGGCFVGETRIAMADGTSHSVADLVEGDFVLGADGRINRVLGVDRLLLENRLLYGLNGSAPFVTASHPFMTDDGWKAVDPTNSYLDHRVLAVGRLTVEDRLVLLSGVLTPVGPRWSAGLDTPLDIRTESMPLTSMMGAAAPASTPLYNLRLDGNHTYFANDLLVHNKFFKVVRPSDTGTFLG